MLKTRFVLHESLLLPYFKKFEHNHDSYFVNYDNESYHSVDVPFNVGFFGEDGTESIRQIFRKENTKFGYSN